MKAIILSVLIILVGSPEGVTVEGADGTQLEVSTTSARIELSVVGSDIRYWVDGDTGRVWLIPTSSN